MNPLRHLDNISHQSPIVREGERERFWLEVAIYSCAIIAVAVMVILVLVAYTPVP